MSDNDFWMPLQTIHYVSGWTSGVLSLSLNVFLLLMIVTKTTGELKNYSRILIQGCIVDMTFTIISLLTHAEIDFDSGTSVMLMQGVFKRSPNPITFHLINLYIFGLFSCVAVLPVPFIFRYFAVCRNRMLSGLQYSSLVLMSVLASVCYTCLHGWTFCPRDNLEDSTYIINYAFWKDAEGNLPTFVAASMKDTRLIILVTFTMLMGSLSYALIIILNIAIYRKLASMKSSMSAKTYEGQRQLSKVLKFQALVPFVICVLPLTLVFILCALGTRTAGKGIILTMLVSWIPVMNPLSAILFVKQYRRCFTTSFIARIICPGRVKRDLSQMNNDITTMVPARKGITITDSCPKPNTVASMQ